MKKINILVAALLISGGAFAQGSTLTPASRISGDNAASVAQSGNNNDATQNQRGNSLGFNGTILGVSSWQNDAYIDQVGNNNKATQTQERQSAPTLAGDKNEARAYQQGSFNEATQIQDGDANYSRINQQIGADVTANYNVARTEQQGASNRATIDQTNGNNNYAESLQGRSGSNSNNTSTQYQNGSQNKGYVDQDSNNNYANQSQFGLANEARTSQGGLGGVNAGVTTNAQWSDIQQNGSYNRATVNQEH